MFNNLKRKRIRNYLTGSSPESLLSGIPGKVIAAYQRAFNNCAAFRKLMEDQSIRPGEIKTMEDFRERVPVIDKNSFFTAFPFNEYIAPTDFRNIKNVMTSSGFSGKFAYGADLRKSSKNARFFVDTALDLLFNTCYKKTFLINCTPMGVHVETSLPLAETSVRSDMAIALLQKVSPFYDQTIIIGDPFFLKKLVEEGCEAGINWKKLNLSLVLGQDWFPESLRSYLATRIDINPDRDSDRYILATMGLTELGLNVFHETPETVRIRRMAQQDDRLREELFGKERKACGYLFHYYPMRFYIEESIEGALLFTTLSKSSVIPLIRYCSDDCGWLVSYNHLAHLLADFKLDHLKPSLKLPLATMSGRASNYISLNDIKLYPEDLKLGLFEDGETASRTTGYFVLSVEEGVPVVQVQLKPGLAPSGSLRKIFSMAFQRHVAPELKINLYRYYEFPYGMELNYEKKFLNIM
jgi:phenylacetate-CoA ligase